MKTSLSTGCVAESRSLDTLGMSASCELFQGTSTSDFGASSLPRIDIPDIFTSPPGCPDALAAAGASAFSSADLLPAADFFAPCVVDVADSAVAGALVAGTLSLAVVPFAVSSAVATR